MAPARGPRHRQPAVLGNTWGSLERVMGIEPTSKAWEALDVNSTPTRYHFADSKGPDEAFQGGAKLLVSIL